MILRSMYRDRSQEESSLQKVLGSEVDSLKEYTSWATLTVKYGGDKTWLAVIRQVKIVVDS